MIRHIIDVNVMQSSQMRLDGLGFVDRDGGLVLRSLAGSECSQLLGTLQSLGQVGTFNVMLFPTFLNAQSYYSQ